jgi:hypothetical protein
VLFSWFGHYFMLGVYTLLHSVLHPLKDLVPSYRFRRWVDAFTYGSSQDYVYKSAPKVQRGADGKVVVPPRKPKRAPATAGSPAAAAAGVKSGGNGSGSGNGSRQQPGKGKEVVAAGGDKGGSAGQP